ncbi:carbohydrate-binding module family 21 protein [Hypoxylon sp. FL1284]|nr:carbohydrate-binding module family 21 protein [Hypoxylon sp. FL1284]
MPYTPPSHRSPASSAPTSPETSRRSSFAQGNDSPRPALPRSSSYLTRHRRTPSAGSVTSITSPVVTDGPTPDITPPGTSDNLKGMVAAHPSPIRQSPPPIADVQTMPPGAIVSPPESSSEDEGVLEMEDRGREIENMKELKEAISAISQHRTNSPIRSPPGNLLLLPAKVQELVGEARQSLLTAGLPALNTSARKISHSRSNTDSNIYISLSKSAETSISTSEEGSEQDEPPRKPQMVRKKSGELVRPALRGQRRPSSMPGTPTFSKAVHFDSHLEHVRHFLQVDRPLAVSAGTSPADNYESDNEYPFKVGEKASPRTPSFEWELVVNNFPAETPIRKALPVRLERVWMSPDQKSLLGSIAVANLAFQKSVVCRFTFDYWKTTSEVAAEYHHEIRPRETMTGHDRFQFCIKLSDLANLEAKTLFFCVRYTVNGFEYWDNNESINFQVDFRKKILSQNGRKNAQGIPSRPANGLPRSTRRTNPSTAPRPRSMPVGALDDFEHDSKLADYDQPLHEVLGESGPIRLKSSKSTGSLPSDNLSKRLSAPSGQAFANRYDFGASLSAARQAHRESSRRGDGLYMKLNLKPSFGPSLPASASGRAPATAAPAQYSDAPRSKPPVSATGSTSSIPGASSPSASIASASYEEILNKYCFVRTSSDSLASGRYGNDARNRNASRQFNGSKQSSPQMKDGTLQSGRYDGVDDTLTQGTNSTDSSSNGSPNMNDRQYHHSSAIHHSLRQNLNPYFGSGYMAAMGASPAESPLSQQTLSPPGSSTPTGRPASSSPGNSFFPLTGTSSIMSSSPSDPFAFLDSYSASRFPFAPDAHTRSAIRG